MAPNNTMISGITQKKPNINIRVKVLKVETLSRRNFDGGKPFLDLTLTDEEGGRIGLTIKNLLKSKYEPILKLQHNFFLRNAFVINNSFKGSGIHWDNDSKLMITPKTNVVEVPASEWVGPDGFKWVSFSDLASTNLKEGVTADVIGKLQHYSEVKKYRDGDELKSKYMNIDLKDLDGVLLSCTIWGQFHLDFLQYMKGVGEDQCVVVIIQMGKTRKYGHKLTVTTDWGNSNLLLDANVPCVSVFRQSILEQHAKDESAGTLAPTLTPPSNPLLEFFNGVTCVGCSELAITEPGMYVVHAKIIAVLPDEPWYYIACKKCNHKAPTVDDQNDLTLDIDAQLALKRKCNGKCRGDPNVGLRFKVCVRVEDANEDITRTVTLTLFETVVSKLEENRISVKPVQSR